MVCGPRAAAEAGARVTLVAGPVNLPTPHGVQALMFAARCRCMKRCCHWRHARRFVAPRGGGLAAIERRGEKIKKAAGAALPTSR